MGALQASDPEWGAVFEQCGCKGDINTLSTVTQPLDQSLPVIQNLDLAVASGDEGHKKETLTNVAGRISILLTKVRHPDKNK